MAVSIADLTSNNTTGIGITSLTTPAFTITSNANRAGILGLSSSSNGISGVTGSIGGTAGAAIAGADTGTTRSVRALQFGVTNPPSGSRTATMSWTGTADVTLGAAATSGVDQATPFNNGVIAQGTTGPSDITIASNVGDLTVDTVAENDGNSVASPTQTQLWAQVISFSTDGYGSRGPGTAGPINHQWTLGGSQTAWAAAGSNFKAAVVAALPSAVIAPARTVSKGAGPQVQRFRFKQPSQLDLFAQPADGPGQIVGPIRIANPRVGPPVMRRRTRLGTLPAVPNPPAAADDAELIALFAEWSEEAEDADDLIAGMVDDAPVATDAELLAMPDTDEEQEEDEQVVPYSPSPTVTFDDFVGVDQALDVDDEEFVEGSSDQPLLMTTFDEGVHEQVALDVDDEQAPTEDAPDQPALMATFDEGVLAEIALEQADEDLADDPADLAVIDAAPAPVDDGGLNDASLEAEDEEFAEAPDYTTVTVPDDYICADVAIDAADDDELDADAIVWTDDASTVGLDVLGIADTDAEDEEATDAGVEWLEPDAPLPPPPDDVEVRYGGALEDYDEGEEHMDDLVAQLTDDAPPPPVPPAPPALSASGVASPNVRSRPPPEPFYEPRPAVRVAFSRVRLPMFRVDLAVDMRPSTFAGVKVTMPPMRAVLALDVEELGQIIELIAVIEAASKRRKKE